jgi:hypothetical protein
LTPVDSLSFAQGKSIEDEPHQDQADHTKVATNSRERGNGIFA